MYCTCTEYICAELLAFKTDKYCFFCFNNVSSRPEENYETCVGDELIACGEAGDKANRVKYRVLEVHVHTYKYILYNLCTKPLRYCEVASFWFG